MEFDNITIEQLTLLVLAIGISGGLLTFGRRIQNPDDQDAGSGAAGWTIFIILLLINKFFNIL